MVLLGNSLSTIISIYETERYADADGLINTGVFVGPYPQGLATLFAAFYPAQFDPKFAGKDIPPGYATTQPGTRTAFFHEPTADPAVIRRDEELKDTATLAEAATFPLFAGLTRTVGIPVLSVMGDHDVLFCSPVCQRDGFEVQKERSVWSPRTCLEVEILSDTGHFIQLQRDAVDLFHALASDWIERRVGTSVRHGPLEPCTADS